MDDGLTGRSAQKWKSLALKKKKIFLNKKKKKKLFKNQKKKFVKIAEPESRWPKQDFLKESLNQLSGLEKGTISCDVKSSSGDFYRLLWNSTFSS